MFQNSGYFLVFIISRFSCSGSTAGCVLSPSNLQSAGRRVLASAPDFKYLLMDGSRRNKTFMPAASQNVLQLTSASSALALCAMCNSVEATLLLIHSKIGHQCCFAVEKQSTFRYFAIFQGLMRIKTVNSASILHFIISYCMKTRRCHLTKAVPILHVSLLSRPGAGGHQTKKGEELGMRVGVGRSCTTATTY